MAQKAGLGEWRGVGYTASEAWEEHRQQPLQWHLEPGHLPSQQALRRICPRWFGPELRSIAWEPPEQHALIKQKETSTHLGGERGSGLLSRGVLSQEHSFLPKGICLTGHPKIHWVTSTPRPRTQGCSEQTLISKETQECWGCLCLGNYT